MLKKMEAAGLLSRERSKEDERTIRVRLTEQGKELKQAAYEIPQKVLCASNMDIDQGILLRDQLRILLTKLTGDK